MAQSISLSQKIHLKSQTIHWFWFKLIPSCHKLTIVCWKHFVTQITYKDKINYLFQTRDYSVVPFTCKSYILRFLHWHVKKKRLICIEYSAFYLRKHFHYEIFFQKKLIKLTEIKFIKKSVYDYLKSIQIEW